jgi:hypothetical protein
MGPPHHAEPFRSDIVILRRPYCKLPRPTRSLPPCGGRSLLEDGALSKRHCAPRPHAWTRPGFLLPSTLRAGAFRPSCDRLRGLSRRFNSRCSRALPRNGDGIEPFAVVVPEYRVRRYRTTGVGLLATPTDPDLCEDGSSLGFVSADVKSSRTRFLPALPLASPKLALEDGGSALPRAELGGWD